MTTTPPYLPPRLFIAAPQKSSGKTTLTVGIAAALSRRGLKLTTFKKGLDFIDPMWHSAAVGWPCRNLDFYTMGLANLQEHFCKHATDCDLSLIEGNLGLFDGQDIDGADCGASMASLLGAPILLVINCKGFARSIAPLINGQIAFPGGERIAGVILNNTASPRHARRLRRAVERYCPVPVVGVVPRHEAIKIDERHLGLVPIGEKDLLNDTIENLAAHIEQHVDLDHILAIARSGSADIQRGVTDPPMDVAMRVRVGYAADRAFSFYYPDNLEALQAEGVELIPVDLLQASELPPDIRGLYIGGGFPEMFMENLPENRSLMQDILEKAKQGMPIYAECGGLMYLSQGIRWKTQFAPMVGALPFEVEMHKKPQGYGYMRIEGSGACRWPPRGVEIPCHEFHYSKICELPKEARFAYKVTRGVGINGQHDGLIYGSIFASYAHPHALGAPGWAEFLREFWLTGRVK
ncbi:cobyrinate a,c-diamide synthase [Magnetococcales bacterium HHB-1]